MNTPRSLFRPSLAKLRPYVPGEQPQGGPSKIIKLNTNENPYPPPEPVIEAIRTAATSGLQRYPDPMANAFRRRAADVLGLPGPEWILAGNGSDELLTILIRAIVGEGETIRLPSPSYILYRTLADIQGARWEEIPFTPDWSLPETFAAATEGLRLAFLPNPNSPSGTVLPPSDVAQLAERLPCPLVVDEAYADFADTNCLDLVRDNDKVFVTRTLSKAYSLAGLRFGFVIAQPERIAELSKIKDSYNCDTLSIAAATAAIGCVDWQAENRRRIVATRQRLAARLGELGFQVTPSQANFVWCQHPDREHAKIYDALKASQVLIRYMHYPDWGDGLRISVGTDEQIDAALLLLERVLPQA